MRTDESYYVSNVESIWRKPEVDLAIDPPPDLLIEVELTSPAIAKMPLFAAMGVPEVWRHDGENQFKHDVNYGEPMQ